VSEAWSGDKSGLCAAWRTYASAGKRTNRTKTHSLPITHARWVEQGYLQSVERAGAASNRQNLHRRGLEKGGPKPEEEASFDGVFFAVRSRDRWGKHPGNVELGLHRRARLCLASFRKKAQLLEETLFEKKGCLPTHKKGDLVVLLGSSWLAELAGGGKGILTASSKASGG
jgi:hypothetical protein